MKIILLPGELTDSDLLSWNWSNHPDSDEEQDPGGQTSLPGDLQEDQGEHATNKLLVHTHNVDSIDESKDIDNELVEVCDESTQIGDPNLNQRRVKSSEGDCIEISNSFRYKASSDHTDFIGLAENNITISEKPQEDVPKIVLPDEPPKIHTSKDIKDVAKGAIKNVEEDEEIRVVSPGSDGQRRSLSSCYREKKMAEIQ